MDKYESFAVGHYLSDWPEGWTYNQIIEALNDDNEAEEYIVIHRDYEDYSYGDVADMINDMESYTHIHFGETN